MATAEKPKLNSDTTVISQKIINSNTTESTYKIYGGSIVKVQSSFNGKEPLKNIIALAVVNSLKQEN